MDRKLHLLESFEAHGSDGSTYKVFGYEHLVRDPSVQAEPERWEPSGTSEYRLADGTIVSQERDGSLKIAGSVVTLTR